MPKFSAYDTLMPVLELKGFAGTQMIANDRPRFGTDVHLTLC